MLYKYLHLVRLHLQTMKYSKVKKKHVLHSVSEMRVRIRDGMRDFSSGFALLFHLDGKVH